jgi:branched-chain amino acid transport system ATP-binding protein
VRCQAREKQDRLDRVFALFPQLSERQKQMAGTLSGGEQQMVAIGRGLMLAPRLLMMDEPSLGLAPNMVARIFDAMAEINRLGVAVLLVEQNVVESLKRSRRAYVLEMGRIVLQGEARGLLEDPRMHDVFLGKGGHPEHNPSFLTHHTPRRVL